MEDKDYTDVREFWKNEIIAFLALTCLKGVGYWTLRKIYEAKLGFKNLLKDSSADA
ncbi:DNA-processing protein DprA, partial [Salmonella enterica subsp. enterica serovar Infantis]|nr:DNA-processing protein DprA [Salmonella enterica subsp. enterica serovar Infantis]